MLPDKQMFIIVPCKSAKYGKKEVCVWITKYKKLSEMCIVQHVEMKNVFTLQPIKRLVSTTVKSAKPVATV